MPNTKRTFRALYKHAESGPILVIEMRAGWPFLKEGDTMVTDIREKIGIRVVCPALDEMIERIEMKLPDKVRRFVVTKCDFLSVGKKTNCAGTTVSTKNDHIKPWLIVLAEEAPEYTVAHEIAHAWLGYDSDLLGSYEQSEEYEKEANHLTKQWGFVRNEQRSKTRRNQ